MEDTGKFHPAGAIFDMDGLMLDTEKPAVPLWIKAGKSLGYDISPQMLIRTLGMTNDGLCRFFQDEFGEDFPYEGLLKNVRPLITGEFENGIAHKPGLLVLLDHLASLGIPLAVATSARRERAIWKLRIAGILDRFSVVACGDEVSRGKPAPDVFLLAAERLEKPPDYCVGFEDSPAGLQGLHAAGIRSVFVKDLVEPPPEILATVWRRCRDLAEAAELFY